MASRAEAGRAARGLTGVLVGADVERGWVRTWQEVEMAGAAPFPGAFMPTVPRARERRCVGGWRPCRPARERQCVGRRRPCRPAQERRHMGGRRMQALQPPASDQAPVVPQRHVTGGGDARVCGESQCSGRRVADPGRICPGAASFLSMEAPGGSGASKSSTGTKGPDSRHTYISYRKNT